jgi:AmiR/NasT family two-component response regulator
VAQVGDRQLLARSDALARLVELNAHLSEKTRQLETALESRIVIEQAKGIIAGRHAVDVQTAFDVLRRAARSNRLNLHQLAQRVIGESETPGEVARYLG